jgi:hypothetical protein
MPHNPEDFSFETEKHTIDVLRQQLLTESNHYEGVVIVPPPPNGNSGAVHDDITDHVSSDGNIDDTINEENPRTLSSDSEVPAPITKPPSSKDKKQIVNPHAYVAKSPPASNRTCSVM